MITALILLTMSLSDPNTMSVQDFASHWLEVKSVDAKVFDPNVVTKHFFIVWPCNGNRDNYIIIRPKDPNDTLDVTSYHRDRFGMADWVIFAQKYPGDPNYVPVGPCELNLVPDPNTPSGYFMCFTDSTKLYHDPNCPYAVQRKTESIPAAKLSEYEPCPVCRPDIKEMLKGVTDPNLIPVIKELMK